ncbi:hypothetical protein Q5752_001669 [Cryptotrichosporon argae]
MPPPQTLRPLGAAPRPDLQRTASSRSSRSSRAGAGVPSPRMPSAPPPSAEGTSSASTMTGVSASTSTALPPPSASASASTSGFGSASAPAPASSSKSGSVMGTPRLLPRRASHRDQDKGKDGADDAHAHTRAHASGAQALDVGRPVVRTSSVKSKSKGKGREDDQSPVLDSPSVEVIETPQLRLERDPETGRKMINQYLVLHEIGHGTHGRVRLGRDMSAEVPTDDNAELSPDTGTHGCYYAIKIVDRNPKKKRLTGFSRQKALRGGRTDGKMVNENEIRKEIAIFKKVNHPNVVSMKEIIDDPESSKLFMILEYCEGGEIRWKEDDGTPALTVAETRKIFRDTLLGLEYLHHQGIIHRDIKPSNLLRSGEHVKISDFGCSHYSEALRVASATGDDDAYVDDVELAKTAGSPAFFAPEMCSSGVEDTGAATPRSASLTPQHEVPSFSVRPPSVADSRPGSADGALASPYPPLRPSVSNDSGLSPHATRTHSSSTIPRRARLPITNAIDVWALGVTLYCLLFAKTPFDAPNEYLLMQVIPVADYEVPPAMGRDRMPTGTADEAKEALDLLRGLLQKDPSKRMTLEQAKHHPFTLRGLPDPSAWLVSTDPHAQTFVTVSNDEVAAVVTKSSSFRERIRKGIKSISHKLQLFSAGRNRSRSIGDSDSVRSDASRPPSAAPSESSAFIVRRPSAPIPIVDPALRSPRQMASTSSLDKLKMDDQSPANSLRRRQSADVDVLPRHRSSSNASSSANFGFGSLVRLLSRNSSQQSSRFGKSAGGRSHRTGSDPDTGVDYDHPSAEVLRGDHDDHMLARRSIDVSETGSSYSSSRAAPSPERQWMSRIGVPTRRGSNLSSNMSMSEEQIPHLRAHHAATAAAAAGLAALEVDDHALGIPPAGATPRVLEEIDWNGNVDDLSDDDDAAPDAGLRPSHATWHLARAGLGLDDSLGAPVAVPGAQPISIPYSALAIPHLDTIPDASPNSLVRTGSSASPGARMAPGGGLALDLHLHRPLSRTPSRGSAHSHASSGGQSHAHSHGHAHSYAHSASSYRSTFGERARSPLGLRDNVPPSPMRLCGDDGDDDDDDEGLVLGGKRGRKGSVLAAARPVVGAREDIEVE